MALDMRLWRILCFRGSSIAAVCALVAASPSSESPHSAGAAIRSAYARLQDAFVKHDAAALSSIVTPDFQLRNADGSVEARDAFINDVTAKTPSMTVSSFKIVVNALTIHGNDARALTTGTYVGTYAYQSAPRSYREVMLVRSDWTLTNAGWKLRSSAVSDDITYIGGKLVQDAREQIAPSPAAIAELRTRAVVMPTLALDADFNQLSGIGSAIGDARIVGMGEGTHGTSEFFAFKNRLFKYLVERKGFTILAMEAYWGAGLYVDRYVKGGPGTAQQAVASLGFWTWRTPEVYDLVRWMRDYNLAPGRHPILSFVGIDMQDPMGAIGYLAHYLRGEGPAEENAAHEALECSADAAGHFQAKPPPDCRGRVADIASRFAAFKSTPDRALAQEAVTNILQYLDFVGQPEESIADLRDHDMAANVQWVAANYPGQKIALWAHNGHVGSTPELSYRPMGSYLRQTFGPAYYVIGQTLGSGTVRAVVMKSGLQSVTVPPNPGDTIAQLFAPLDAVAFLDLRGLPPGSALRTFFSAQHGIWETGAAMDPAHPSGAMPIVVLNSFDGLVYVPISTASVFGLGPHDMQRAVHENGADWEIAGPSFDDVTVSTTSTQATLTNSYAVNSSPNSLLRRFSATLFAGKTVTITGEVRAGGLLGYALPLADATAPNAAALAVQRGDPIDAFRNVSWTPISLTLKVPANASFIDAGFLLDGFGSLEVRNLQIVAASQ